MINHTFKHASGKCFQVPYDVTTKQYQYAECFLDLSQVEATFNAKLIPNARFLDSNDHNKPVWLPFDQKAGKALHSGKWFLVEDLARYFGFNYSPVVKPLGKAVSTARLATQKPRTR